ncbi:bidirectional sugar transporter SWEET6b-like [Aristolochia californica]|uniref:bidirectional sugar transporter SWEET6b-like n=1 Tax=Aristolochia californica TaxID=171875 RepID=UPI0035E1F8C9
MVSPNAIRNVVGIIGNVMAIILFLSPAPTFYKIWKKRSTEKFKADPYLATVLNCTLWVFYGLPLVHPNNLLVVTSNCAGFALEAIFLIIYFTFANKKQRRRVALALLIEVAFVAAVISLVLSLAHTHKLRTRIVGIICMIINCAMYASPLTIMRIVMKTKSVKYMPFYLSLAGFLTSVCWAAYALIEFDLFIVIPNGAGVVLGIIQLILYGWFYRSTNWDDDEAQIPEVQPPKPLAQTT